MTRFSFSCLPLLALLPGGSVPAGTAPDVDRKALDTAVKRAVAFLETKGQSADGSYSGFSGPGVTALATTALLRRGRTADSPSVAKSLTYLEQFVHPDGGIY